MIDLLAHAPVPIAVFHGPRQDLVGASTAWLDMFHVDVPGALREKVEQVWKTGKKVVKQLVLDVAGTELSFRVIVQPLPEDQVMVTCVDQAQSGRARDDAARSERLGEMLAAMSHDLRAPMSTIMLWERVLRETTDPVVRSRALDAIHDSAVAQCDLVAAIGEVAAILGGTAPLQRGRVAAEHVLDAAAMTLRPEVDRKRLHLVQDFERPLGQIDGDRQRLINAVSKLVEHAIKIRSSGQTVTIAARRRRTTLLVSIGDVYRERDAREGEAPAAELELMLVNELIVLHGGRLDVVRPEGGGARTFWVRLPLSPRETAA